MHTATTFLSWVLATAPASDEPFTVDRVDVEQSDESVQLTALDPDGEVSGEVVLWVDDAGQIRLDANFADGLYLSVVTDDATIETEDRALVSERMLAIQAALPEPAAIPQWIECAGTVVLAGVACTPPIGFVGFFACAGAATAAGCSCLETFSDGNDGCFE